MAQNLNTDDPVGTYENILEHEDEDRQAFAVKLDKFVLSVGHIVMWANVALIVAIIAQVALRYLFDINLPKLDELQWHLYGLTTMVGLSYCYGERCTCSSRHTSCKSEKQC